MKKYIITSPAFTGQINVLYSSASQEGVEQSKLLYLDFMKCELTDEQLEFFKTRVPIHFNNKEEFTAVFGNSRLDVVEEGFKVSFEQWWTRYSLKRNRERCMKIWQTLSEADQVNAFFKLGMYERYLMLQAWRTKAEPDTYLRKRYWDNEWK